MGAKGSTLEAHGDADLPRSGHGLHLRTALACLAVLEKETDPAVLKMMTRSAMSRHTLVPPSS
jgi:hypothetical protein